MRTTRMEFIEKRTKRVVVVYDVPVKGVLSNGDETLDMNVAKRVEEIVDAARRAKLPHVEARYVPKVIRATARVSPRKAA